MNVLREVRKIFKKNIIVKIRIFSLLCILLISSAYAWFITVKNLGIENVEGKADSWDTIYVHDDEIYEKEVTVGIKNFYPGKEYTKIVNIYNTGTEPSNVQVELIDVRLFENSMLDYIRISANQAMNPLIENGRILDNEVCLFGNEEYPFEIKYSLDKNSLQGKFNEEDPTQTPLAQACLTLNFSWKYNDANSADSQIASKVQNYYNTIQYDENKEELKSKMLEVKLKIRSNKQEEQGE